MISNEINTLQVGNFTFVSQLNVIIGNKCTAKCDFCTNDSSPKGKIHLASETCKQLVRQAKELGFNRVGFSGGEPFLYRELLLELTEIAESHSLGFVIATNGYWGKNPQEAETLMLQLRQRGLTKLQLSYDVEHAKYVKVNAIYNVLKACKSAGIPVILYSAYYPGEKRIHELLDLSDFKNVEINEGEVMRVGRARNNVVKFISKTADTSPIGQCPKLLQMTVNFDGEIYPCCSVGSFSSGLSIGNVTSHKLDDLSKSILAKTFVSYLQNHDATWIAKEIEKDTGLICNSVCELCHVIHSEKELLKKYSSIAEEAMLEAFFQNAGTQSIA